MIVAHTIETPAWIKALVEDVLVDAVVPLGFIGPLGYRYWEPDDPENVVDAWQIAVYPTASEIRGSDENDGAVFVSGFRLDVGKIMACFAKVEDAVWSSPAKFTGNLDGPEISLRGLFVGKEVWLRFFHLPPSDESPSYAVDPQRKTARQLPA